MSAQLPNIGLFSPAKTNNVFATTFLLSLAVLLVWVFPRFWYSKTDPQRGHFWLAEQDQISSWQFRQLPVSQAAEAALAADRIVNGEFAAEGRPVVRVFSAKRYSEEAGEFDMFSHTPDRCWTSVGWKLEPAAPEFIELALPGITMKLERRIFTDGTYRELVYFGALVGGQP